MPPAFNLSQDQTLQFDLFLTQRNRSELHFYFRERFKQVSKIAFGVTPLQAPTLIGCNLLKNFRNCRRFQLFLAPLTCCRQRRIELCQRFYQLVNTFRRNFLNSSRSKLAGPLGAPLQINLLKPPHSSTPSPLKTKLSSEQRSLSV